ncbi:hypothetical protein BJ166DRAFT_490712 [Pestalotiopsis sp. NC0098]|nr:hypothetical protein BJ166DRAFT_490712 [Pestalotiopsis sp. NC0098]
MRYDQLLGFKHGRDARHLLHGLLCFGAVVWQLGELEPELGELRVPRVRPDPPKAAPPVRFGQGPKLANNGDSSSGASYWILSDFRLIYVLASLSHAGLEYSRPGQSFQNRSTGKILELIVRDVRDVHLHPISCLPNGEAATKSTCSSANSDASRLELNRALTFAIIDSVDPENAHNKDIAD